MVSIDYLVTTLNKTKDEIRALVEASNIRGNVIVGNQGCEDNAIYNFSSSFVNLTIINQKSRGVSKNRNLLLRYSRAEYITFLDDDVYYKKDCQEMVEKIVIQSQKNCVRFNVTSDNSLRPIKQLLKNGYVGFRSLSSFGVWGCFYRRAFLLDNNIFFNENIGPGTEINHGEDTLFQKTFLKHSKVFSFTLTAFNIIQTSSTWQGTNRRVDLELFSHGYLYYHLYPFFTKTMAIIFLITHKNIYPKGASFCFLKKQMFKGINAAKRDASDIKK